ncbi:DegT/DnrJ/EryC1/StrS family aminotransferase [Spirosoma endbachense]|uniref:Aminotransferase class I/II-fold pyridoxal phosphate-dependent enzyme n=1 Tax=Spirosoma endbachense TaxID=2666025 RepID=A0A6P1W9K6_9BACT|nr:DegT/DnrJ/EryC1/StrS family aminotransferase [Spirosoma endbachense]QHW01249.1 aminotransferase class I/II-fold pyridoxal phosphate-dependent enzyme [Spirosoma endbachense]
MVDLKNQYLKIKPVIDAAIQECIDTSSFIKGPQLGRFEKRFANYLNVRHVIACANGTDALQIAMMALDLQPDDEVIVPAFTYVATAEVIALLRLKPVMVDVDPQTFTISPAAIEQAITAKTKLVVPVHLFGQCADMERIETICSAHDLFMVEDAAQAVGASYTFSNGHKYSAGAMGTLGTTSFFPSKNLGCFGDGGAIYTTSDVLAEKVKMIANHGQIRKYEHEIIGVNSRLDSIQAAVLNEKLNYLTEYTQARQQVAAAYDEAFENIEAIEVPYRMPGSDHVFHQYTLKVPAAERDNLQLYLSQKKIPSMVYYPKPLHSQKAYQTIGRVVGDLSVTEALCKRVISLPIHTELSDEQVSYISEAIVDFFS